MWTGNGLVSSASELPHITLIVCRPIVVSDQPAAMIEADKLSARELLAHNLRRNRKALGLSQEALAELAGIHRNYLGGVERCERNVGLDNLERLARALQISVAELLAAQ